MPDLKTRAAMGADPALRGRVVAAVIQLAINVISMPEPAESPDPAVRLVWGRRRGYALDVTANVAGYAPRAQYAIACWDQSTLADVWAAGGADAITDEQIVATLAAVWDATGGA